MRNSKLETLNSKQTQNTKSKTQNDGFGDLNFGFWICLEFRI